MKGQTKIFIYLLIILSFIALFSISCNNNKDKTGTEDKDKTGTGERKLSYYVVIGGENFKKLTSICLT